MKNLKKYFVPIIAVALLSVLAALIINFYPRNSAFENKQSEIAGLQPPKAESEEFEGNQTERKKWFLEQRLYGLGEIPAGARNRAKETADLIAPPLADALEPANTWTLIGPQPTHSTVFTNAFGDSSGRINAITVHPTTPNTVLLGTATGGIWRSTNALADPNGMNPPVFVPVSDSQVDLAVGSIAFAPSNPAIVYAGMGDSDNGYLGTGVLRSADTGATWTRVDVAGLPPRSTTSKIAVSLTDPNTVFLSRVEYFQGRGPQAVGGFYRSTDGGANWTRTFAGSVSSIATHPTNGNVIYISVLNTFLDPAPVKGIYRSVDGGLTFAAINGAIDFTNYDLLLLATTAANPQKIYAYGGTQAAPVVLGAVNDGVNPIVWTQNPLTFNQFDSAQFNYNAYIAADPFVDGRLFIGSRDVYRTILNPATNTLMSIQNISNSFTYNMGTNQWDYTLNGSKVHADQQSFAFAGNTNTFFTGSDGGINRTTDDGATFTQNLNRSLGLTQSIGVSIHPTNANIAYTGTQDNGTQRRENGNQWKEFSNGDGGHAVINPLDPSMVFTSYVQGSFSRFTANGTAFSAQINQNFGGMRVNFYMPLVGNRTDATLYTGTQTLAVCTDCATSPGNGTWTFPAGAMSDLTRGGFDIISAVGVQNAAFTNTQVIYIGTNGGAFQVSQNGGATFTNRTTEMDNAVHNNMPPFNPGRTITNIRVDPANAGTAYITVSGFGTQHLFRSTNFGATIAPVPFMVDIPANDFMIHPTIPTTFYLATDIGIFRSTDSGATWNQFNTGMPPVVVTRFDSAPDGRLAASTYGRGIYQVNVVVASAVTVAGRVTRPSGTGIANLRLTLTDNQGQIRFARTDVNGNYSFSEVPAGETYTFAVHSRRWQFANNPRVITVLESIETLDFVAGKSN
jgi:hypothetical protein